MGFSSAYHFSAKLATANGMTKYKGWKNYAHPLFFQFTDYKLHIIIFHH